MRASSKDWDRHVIHAEEIARGEGFCALRDAIVERAQPRDADRVLDVGAGTGLLTLALAARVSRVWALDLSSAMCEYLRAKAASAGASNVHVVTGSAISLPLVDQSIDLVVSNYCFHHLETVGKQHALAEARRVLAPGGRLVFGDMMFGIGLRDPRDRRVIARKSLAMLRRGPAGVARLGRNAGRLAIRRWEHPARSEWWREALADVGFGDISVEPMHHEGGLASARKPHVASPQARVLTGG